jgi:hypothetical protein
VDGSIDYRALPGLRRDDVLADPGKLDGCAPLEQAAWWRVADPW